MAITDIEGPLRPALTVSRRTLLGGLALSALTLAGCSTSGKTPDPLLAAHDLAGLDARAVIDRLEELPLEQRPTDLLAAVLHDRVSLSDAEGRETSLLLPAGESYISAAPYVRTTHECFHHSLTTCLGELQEQEIEVLVTATDGEVLMDEVRTTAPNGFLGLWLPRDQELMLTLTQEGKSASTPLSTDAESPTCVTTMQLGA